MSTVADQDLLSPELTENPFAYFAELRASDPVHWAPASKAWLLTRYDDVVAAFGDPRLWDSGRVTPAPLQRPLPVWVGARGPRGARLAGRTGAGLLWIDRDLFGPYLAGLAQADPPALPRVGGLANVFLADDPDRVMAAVREHGRRNRASYEDAGTAGTAGSAGREAAFPKLRILTPAAAAAWISELCTGLPVTDVFCFGDIGGLDDNLVERHTELAVRELAPVLANTGLAGEGEL